MSIPGTTVVFCSACGAHNAPDARFCQSCGQAMAQVRPLPVTSSIAVYASHPYGGFWVRVVAWFIDAIVVGIILLPLSLAFGTPFVNVGPRESVIHIGFGFVFMRVLLRFVVVWLYEALLTSSSYQATLGKMVFGLRVTDLAGNRIDFARASGRVFAKILSGMILGIGFLMVAFTERKQGLHDMVAGTLVQKTR